MNALKTSRETAAEKRLRMVKIMREMSAAYPKKYRMRYDGDGHLLLVELLGKGPYGILMWREYNTTGEIENIFA
jgi:hypothetical protein